jgi:hypothetical protein
MEPIANPLFVGSNPTSASAEIRDFSGEIAKQGNTSDNRKSPDNTLTDRVSGCGAVVEDAGPKPGRIPPYRRHPSGCWVWQRGLDRDGYGYFRRGGKSVRAHIHYYEERHGATPDGTELDHTCRNRACVNPAHLEPVTHLENCRRGGLVKTGMTIEKAREIRRLHAEKVAYRVIAERFGIGQSLIAQIVTNRCWKESAPAPAKGVAK